MTPDEIRRRFEEYGVRRVKVGAFDIDATLRGKYISLEKFWSAVDSGLGFCDVVFGWDIGDALYDNVKFTGWHTGYPDAQCRIDLESFRPVPWEPGTAFFLLDMETPIAPRETLRRVLRRAAEMGYEVHASVEYEFFFFRETPASLRAKNFHGLAPLSPGMFGYSVLRASSHSELLLQMLDQLAAFDVPMEGLHTETGPGVYEAAIAAESGIRAADRGALFKTAVKEIAATARIDPHLHGEVERGPAWVERPHPPEPVGGGRQRLLPRRRHGAIDGTLHRRGGGQPAGDDGADLPNDQFIQAHGAGRLGADQRDLGHRQPHHGGAGHPRTGK